MLTSLFIAISLSCLKEEVDEYAMVTFLIGDVRKNNTPVQIGDIIKEKDELRTSADSFADIKIGGSIIRIKEKTRVIMSGLIRKNNMENTTLNMNIGKMLVKPKKLLKSESFLVKTPTAIAGVRGTRFIVEADRHKTTRIKVFDGKLKVAKRVKQFEESVDKVLETAPVLEKERKVIITEKEVKKVEKNVDKLIKSGREKDIASVIKKMKNEVAVSRNAIQRFKVEEFVKENREIIAIRIKPREVVRKIVKVIKQEKEMPKPDGRLLVTRYEIYFIKNGRVMWEGNVIDNPIKKGDKIYIASGDYVFCALSDGPVLWRKSIENNGKLQFKDNALVLFSKGRETKLDLETGEKL